MSHQTAPDGGLYCNRFNCMVRLENGCCTACGDEVDQ